MRPFLPVSGGLSRLCLLRANLRWGAMAEKFERHRQPWTTDELQKLHRLAGKGMGLKAIAKALTRSEESTDKQAKAIKLKIAKLR